MKVDDVLEEIIDRAHYVTKPGGPIEARYISINEHALRAAIASVLYMGSSPRRPSSQRLPADPEAPDHCIPGPGCRHGR
jgi:hypothetical protein